MCGRFTLILEPEAIQNELNVGVFPSDYKPRFNIAPSQPVAVVTNPQTRAIQWFRWGLIPSWAKDTAIGNRMINARAETLAEKPAFKTALSRRRCIILADGFYEWNQTEGMAKKGKTPYWFHLTSGKPFAFAGLWDTWHSPGGEETILSCTLITTSANEHVARFHDRMPVILDQGHVWNWLDPQASQTDVSALLKPYPADQMTSHPVSNLVNSPGNDNPQCIEPIIT
jgi:putative SOS response-associated peptidase YedK